MPELPEVEHLRRTLAPRVVGAAISEVTVLRRDVVRDRRGRRTGGLDDSVLLRGATIRALHRRGKQLAIEADDGRVLCVHLGMSGQLRWVPPGRRIARGDHVHVAWRLRRGTDAAGRLLFRDPRRFGGIWCFAATNDLLRTRWDRLGPDALDIDGATLAGVLAGRRAAVKAILLDQAVAAGIGNIYADEALHRSGIDPRRPAAAIGRAGVERLAASIRSVLREAVQAGGSTLRDYVDGNGEPGGYAAGHRVYGRAGAPCLGCGRRLLSTRVAQRMTVWCPGCQRSGRARLAGAIGSKG